MSKKTESINLESIRVDERTQQRPLDGDNITRLAELLGEVDDFTQAIEVFRDSDGSLYLAHGHHRYHAYRQAGFTHVEARIYQGDLEAAIDHSCKPLNALHGKPETAEDRRKRIERMIERHPKWSHRQLAAWVGVSHTTVAEHRKSGVKKFTPETGSESQNGDSGKRTGRDGKKYPAKKKAPKKKKASTSKASSSGNGKASSGSEGSGSSSGSQGGSEGDGGNRSAIDQMRSGQKPKNGAEVGSVKERREAWKGLQKIVNLLDKLGSFAKYREALISISEEIKPPEK